MDAKLKKKWLRALRSGEYKQGAGQLCSADGEYFCCLGVLADIQGARWHEATDISHNDVLWPEIKGIKPSKWDTMLAPREAGGLKTYLMKRLATFNDESGLDFNEIADYIEEHVVAE